jgi:poly-beta-1,6-N-acetyl-D-glucosamine synthase
VIVVAYNEAQRIERRIENLLSLDYPRRKLEIVIASDGSTDGTEVCAGWFEKAGVRVRAFDSRRGKAAVLNDVVPSSRGEIVVLADARQRFDRGTLRALVNDFGDAHVGAVSGELVIR